MANIRLLEELRSEQPAIRQEARDAIYAYVGAPERIVMRCERWILDDSHLTGEHTAALPA